MMRVFLVATLLMIPPLAAQQGPPDSLINTKFFAHDTPVRIVINQMRGITQALGVRCTYCHVGEEGQNIWSYDFASDEKPAKLKARVMMEMVRAINDEHLARLAEFDAQGLEVTCNTCHRGVALPIALPDLLSRSYADSGLAAMEARYAALKQRYYGSGSYDFGESALAAVAGFAGTRGALDDAVRIYVTNAGLFPESGVARFQVGEAQLAVGDTAAAVASFRRALELDPRNPVARRRLQLLTPGG
jgi:tetratricopeptide (TPR) repeat protein